MFSTKLDSIFEVELYVLHVDNVLVIFCLEGTGNQGSCCFFITKMWLYTLDCDPSVFLS